MVEVKEILLEILKNERRSMDGHEIKSLVEAIILAESAIKTIIEPDKDKKSPEQIIKEWMGD